MGIALRPIPTLSSEGPTGGKPYCTTISSKHFFDLSKPNQAVVEKSVGKSAENQLFLASILLPHLRARVDADDYVGKPTSEFR
jgi:hypothetical protein